ncbi:MULTISPECIES: efflux RND transporter periplasmic adaptor subunit [Selenomonas]|uniref:Membrane fusion protein, multidrug efflux system n=1 Tax=Selenomonas ruminantium TaxID=971 RepID=A0A1K1M1R6_SELRU|nr:MULTISPECIES: efflux RND transporter periplasmic adaptor subunit [Selenomonas]SFW17039.1 membrane fusion protein, multidrug efflux system [Selenomonas ruminantium]
MAGFLGRKTAAIISTIILGTSIIFSGCGQQEQAEQKNTPVKAMKVIQQDTPIAYSYPGHLQGKEEVQVHARVSGSILEKYFSGGDFVYAGQPLYKLDSRQYETAVISAQAELSKAESNLRNAQEELGRYETLWKDRAVSEQTLTNKRADVEGYMATVAAERAAVRKAQENLDDTIVYAPMSGRVSVDDVAVGTYATAGTTTLVTVGTMDPINVQFSVSETEYLNLLAEAMETGVDIRNDNTPMPRIKISLSNGKDYPYIGDIIAADRALSTNAGSLTIRATIANPQGILLPGMFVQVRLVGTKSMNAMLVPQRAVQQLLDESFVLVVGENGKSISKNVKVGEKVGSYYIIEKGLEPSDVVIVEGLTNLQAGQGIDVTMVTPDEMGFSITESKEITDKS